ncbi:MAG: hypothetical protein FJ044_03225, partial [Candidatus Cloacimonetes bacterium]|nr:hypothetical protein [Candidatus Cloacimonadota bacterium]
MPEQQIIRGTKEEQKTFTEAMRHYSMAKEDLDSRLSNMDTIDELFRSYLDEDDWPYQSLVFDPRTFNAILEKTARLLANKPRGRLVPREGGDSLGAKINNELLRYQWDDNERISNLPMLAKWAILDMNARKYGAGFALCKWRYEMKTDLKNKKKEIWFDGPDFKPLINRDCLPNPSYSFIKNWFQHRDYLTLQELENINDAARSTEKIYKNLDLLRDALREGEGKGGDRRATNWTSKNLSIKGLTDYLGQDEYFKVIEVVTEYRNNRWITFAPKHGVVLRDISNPYEHGQIPVVMLRYYPVDDDLYGLSEIEPVESIQKAINALVCQYLDTVNINLYTPLKVRKTGVEMHTLEFGPGKKWLMNDPATDVIPYQASGAGVAEFGNTYRFLTGAMQAALGSTSAGISNLVPGESKKTATEIQDLALQRSARDNFNQIFLAEALKKQMMFWFLMNRQFLFSDPTEKVKVIRIVGKDAIRYFQKRGLDSWGISDGAAQAIVELRTQGVEVLPEEFMTPLSTVETKEGKMPKFRVEESGEAGYLLMEKEDISGNYDYIPDIESMQLPTEQQVLAVKK